MVCEQARTESRRQAASIQLQHLAKARATTPAMAMDGTGEIPEDDIPELFN